MSFCAICHSGLAAYCIRCRWKWEQNLVETQEKLDYYIDLATEHNDLLLRYRAALVEIGELHDVRADEASSIASRALDDEEGR